jgi:hypothetical protein
MVPTIRACADRVVIFMALILRRTWFHSKRISNGFAASPPVSALNEAFPRIASGVSAINRVDSGGAPA